MMKINKPLFKRLLLDPERTTPSQTQKFQNIYVGTLNTYVWA